MKWVGLVIIKAYQLTLSHILPASCRFEPSCSHYSYEAINRYGLWKGGKMATARIARCHPFHPGGYDPVP